jgi:hypothetical protein
LWRTDSEVASTIYINVTAPTTALKDTGITHGVAGVVDTLYPSDLVRIVSSSVNVKSLPSVSTLNVLLVGLAKPSISVKEAVITVVPVTEVVAVVPIAEVVPVVPVICHSGRGGDH